VVAVLTPGSTAPKRALAWLERAFRAVMCPDIRVRRRLRARRPPRSRSTSLSTGPRPRRLGPRRGQGVDAGARPAACVRCGDHAVRPPAGYTPTELGIWVDGPGARDAGQTPAQRTSTAYRQRSPTTTLLRADGWLPFVSDQRRPRARMSPPASSWRTGVAAGLAQVVSLSMAMTAAVRRAPLWRRGARDIAAPATPSDTLGMTRRAPCIA